MKDFVMNKILNLATIITCLALILSACAYPHLLKYELSPEKIKRVYILDLGNGNHGDLVELLESDKKDFSNLTRSHVGKKLIILFAGRTLTTAVLKTEISSGHIMIGKWKTKAEAEQMREMLLGRKSTFEIDSLLLKKE